MQAGIDFSMTCPAICIIKDTHAHLFWYIKTLKYQIEFSEGDYHFYGYPTIKKRSKSDKHSQLAFLSRAIVIVNKIDEIVGGAPKPNIVIEGYSFGSKGMVFGIGEATGALKQLIASRGYDYKIVAPSTLKKITTGNGNSKKIDMYNAWIEATGIDLTKKLGNPEKNPISDIVDAWALSQVPYMNIQ